MKKIFLIALLVFSVLTRLWSWSKEESQAWGALFTVLAEAFFRPSLEFYAARPDIKITLNDLNIQDKKTKQLYELILSDTKSEKALAQIKKLQAEGLDINAKLSVNNHYPYGGGAWSGELTPLAWALTQRKKQSMVALLEAGADPNERFKWVLSDRDGSGSQTRQSTIFIYLTDYFCDPEYLNIALRYGLNPDEMGQATSGDYIIASYFNKLTFEADNSKTAYIMSSDWSDMKVQYLVDAGVQLSNRPPYEHPVRATNEYGRNDLLAEALKYDRFSAAWFLIINGASINNVYAEGTQRNDPAVAIRQASVMEKASPEWQFAKKIVHYYRSHGYPSAFLSADVQLNHPRIKAKDEEGDYYYSYIYDKETKYPKYEDEYWYPYQAQSPSAMALERATLSEAYYLQKLTTPTPMDDLWRARYYLKIKQYSLALKMLEQSQTKPITSPQAQGYIKDALNELLATGYSAVLSDKLKALLTQR